MIDINELKTICIKLCNKYDINLSVGVIIANLNNEGHGRFDSINNTILINDKITNQEFAISVVCHEFRHLWQKINYPEIYDWWVSHPSVYDKYYWTLFCSIERDAFLFGDTYTESNRQDLLDMYSVNDLQNIVDNNAIDFALKHLEYLEDQRIKN